MKPEIKERIEQVHRGEVPLGYAQERAMLYPSDWGTPCALSTVLYENKARNEELRFGKDQVLSVSGENGVVNQVEFMGRSYAGESVAQYHVVEIGNIVYTKSPLKKNPYGIIKLNKGFAGIVSTLYAVYCCEEPITGQYIENYFDINSYLNNYLKPLVKRGAKNDMKVNNEDVLTGKIPLPSLAEQKNINEVIDGFNQLIELKKQLIEEKRRQRKSLMQKLLDPDDGVRLPEFKGTWKKRRLGDIGKIRKGGGISAECTVQEGLPAMMYGDIYIKYNISFSEVDYRITADTAKKSTPVKSGDLLFTATGETAIEIGKCVCYQGIPTIYIGGDIFSLTPKSDNSMFLSYQLNSFPAIKQKARYGQGYSVVHIGVDSLKKVQVLLPPTIKEQTAIANILSAADREIDLLEQELEAWQQKRKALMQLLLTGLVRV